MAALPTLPTSPAVFDPGTAAWADAAAAWIAFLAAPPLFIGYQATGQVITTATTSGIALDTEVVDTHNGHDIVTNNSRYFAPYPGWYDLDLRIAYPTAASGRALLGYGVNSATIVAETFSPLSSGQSTGITLTDSVFLNAGDYVVGLTSQNSPGSLSLISTASAPRGTQMKVEWSRSA